MKKDNDSINRFRCFFCFFLLSFFSFYTVGYPAVSSYFDTVQKIYMGYYQRPGDPAGLLYWADLLQQNGGNLNQIIEAFADSNESRALYGTINSSNISTVVNNLYRTLFSRDADTGGRAYYVDGFNAGRFTAATIMLNILNGAQNEDLQSVNNKRTASNLFTRTIDPELDGANFQVTYSGEADAIAGRNFLTLYATSVKVPTQAETTAYIQANIANSGDPILSIANTVPVANAGANQNVVTGTLVTLDGSGSSDADGDLLTYSWSFTSKPTGSGAALSSVTVAKPTFTPDAGGVYLLNLVVNDGKANSTSAAVTITASGISATIEVDTAQGRGAVRDLFGVNKNPRAPQTFGSTTIHNVAALYQQLGISHVRTHDCGIDLCGTYTDATLYDMTTTTPTVLSGTCTAVGTDGLPLLKWNVNNPGNVNNPDNYDFTEVDRVIANIRESGAALYLRLGQKYNGPSDTDDPDAWSKVAVNIYKHIIGQFKPSGESMDPVAVEVYNEPDGSFWRGNKSRFMTYFNNTVDGVRSAGTAAGKSLRVGGPGFTDNLVNHFGSTENVASTFIETATPDRLDFLSVHHYSECADATLGGTVEWFDSVRAALATKGYPQSKPLDITEYNIGLGTACGNTFFGDVKVQSFTSGILTLMQQVDEWNIERAMFYAGFPNMALITTSTRPGNVTVNPSAWAFWAHSQMKGGTLVSAETCVTGSACVSGKSAATAPIIALAARLLTGRYLIIVTNTTGEERTYTLNLKGLAASTANIQVRTPMTTTQTLAMVLNGSEYSPTSSGIAELLAKITTQSMTLPITSGLAQAQITLPAWSLNVIEVAP